MMRPFARGLVCATRINFIRAGECGPGLLCDLRKIYCEHDWRLHYRSRRDLAKFKGKE